MFLSKLHWFILGLLAAPSPSSQLLRLHVRLEVDRATVLDRSSRFESILNLGSVIVLSDLEISVLLVIRWLVWRITVSTQLLNSNCFV